MRELEAIIAKRHRIVPFTSVWTTTTPNEIIELPMSDSLRVDWGDGEITDGATSHTYAIANTYTIRINGRIDTYSNVGGGSASKDKIQIVEKFGSLLISGQFMYGCTNMDITATDIPRINSLYFAFRNCNSLVGNSSMNNWNLSDTTRLDYAFFRCYLFNQDISSWDTSSVTHMDFMFRETTAFNQDISSWDFSSVTSISNFMFGKTFNNYNASFYDNLLIKWDNSVGGLVFSNMTNVNIGMGSIKYTTVGATARASLVSKGFVVSDGGQV